MYNGIKKFYIDGLYIVKPHIYGDHRGYFFESYNEEVFCHQGLCNRFVQDSQPYSTFGTIRVLHFQLDPFAQAKLVRVIKGKVLDVVVDLRKDSTTFGQKYSIELSDENRTMLFMPRGFAHGFSVF